MKAVVNSTPLIALSMIDYLFVLEALFNEIFVPSSLGVYEHPKRPFNWDVDHFTETRFVFVPYRRIVQVGLVLKHISRR